MRTLRYSPFSVIKPLYRNYLLLYLLCSSIAFLITLRWSRHNYFHHNKLPVVKAQGDWQQVSSSTYLFSVYSAFGVISSNGPELPEEIVIIASTKTNSEEVVTCVFSYRNNPASTSMTAFNFGLATVGEIDTVKVHRDKQYAGVLVHCPLPQFSQDLNILPETVSIVAGNSSRINGGYYDGGSDEWLSNILPIQYKLENDAQKKGEIYEYNFSICVLPLFNYTEVFHFLEWIEFNKLMGVEQFTFYNISLGPEISCVLHEMINGADPFIKVNVYPYHENPIKGEDVVRGRCSPCVIDAASNDCSYRHRGRLSKYMLLIDIDEFLMPQEGFGSNYAELLKILDEENYPNIKKIAEYRFLNAFFPLDTQDDYEEKCLSYKNEPLSYFVCRESFIMSKVTRNKYLQRFNSRTKCITKPEGIKENSYHSVNVFEEGYEALNVSQKFAYSRHYRFLDDLTNYRSKYLVLDETPIQFGRKVIDNLAAEFRFYIKKCNLSLEGIL